MKKFITLHISHLQLDDLAGLTAETLRIAPADPILLGEVGMSKRQALDAATSEFVTLMNKERKSLLTPKIAEEDKRRDALFADIKRNASAAAKSPNTEKSDAGKILVTLFEPFWKINTERLMSQTEQLEILKTHYNGNAAARNAATALGLDGEINDLFAANATLVELYNQRLSETALLDGASATSVKEKVVASYDELCVSVEYILSAAPNSDRQALFHAMNDIRRKYISHVPVKLDPAHTSTAPIPVQEYTGKHVTPLPRVFFQTEKETKELVFAQDFTVTYKNNVEVGEAKLYVHDKGKYSGTYDTNFHIAR
jgi:hypothetical protein